MADGRRTTRSMFKAVNEDRDSSSPPKKKRKSNDVKQTKPNEPKRVCKGTKQDKCKEKKTSSQLKAHCSHQAARKSLYEVETQEMFNIRTPGDAALCVVSSMCMLDSGDLLMTDFGNPVLKQIDSETYAIRHSLELCTRTHSVCKVDETEAVVALSNKSIQFVSTQDKLVPTRSLKLDHNCLGVGVLSNNIFITDGINKNIFVYDMDGAMLRQVHGGNIFSWNRFIVESDDRNAIYVTDSNRGLIKMDRNCEAIWKCCHKRLKKAYGLCTDGLGSVFVSGNDSGNVVQIASDGKYLGEVVPKGVCVPNTAGVCFNRQKSKLFVARYKCDDIYVYRLK